MDISVTGRNFQLTDSTKDYTYDKVANLSRFHDRITDVKAVLSKGNGGFACEVIIAIPSKQNIVVAKESDKLFGAIDESVGICERKLRQYKNKRRDMKGNFHDVPDDQV